MSVPNYETCVQNYYANSPAWVEFTDEEYDWFLGCVPPITHKGDAYLSGEPYTHNSQNEPVYLAMHQDEGKNLGRLMTEAHFRDIFCAPNAYEQKLERRRERFERYAENASRRSAQHFTAADRMASVIPFGQPILVGHYSERSDRRYRGRIHSHMDKGCEEHDKAKYFEQKAESVGKGGISSDDPAAISKLAEELTKAERLQDHMRAANKIIKSKRLADAEKIAQLGELGISESAALQLFAPDFCGRIGYPDYALTNNSANVRRIRARIEELKQRASATPREPITGEGFTIEEDREENRVMFRFPSKPSAAIRTILKSQSFKWSPPREAWVRMLNNAGRYAAERAKEQIERLS